jgi:hypothetical protein
MCFLEPRLQEGPVVDELVVVRKHLGFDRLVPFSFKADSVPLVVPTSGFLGSLLGTAGVEGWVDIDKVD